MKKPYNKPEAIVSAVKIDSAVLAATSPNTTSFGLNATTVSASQSDAKCNDFDDEEW